MKGTMLLISWQLKPMKRAFPDFLHCLQSLDRLIRDLGRVIPSMQMPDVDVIRAKYLKTRVQVLQYVRFLRPAGLAGDYYLVSFAFDHTGKDFFAVAVIAGGVEVINAHVNGARDNIRNRHESYAVTDPGNL